MGSSGEKRKGRKHLPKVGSPAENSYAIRRERQAVGQNFGIRPGSGMAWVLGGVLVVGALIAILALVVLN